MANRDNKSKRSSQASAGVTAAASKEALSTIDELSPGSVEKIMTTETLGTKMDTQTATLHQEVAFIHQELHTTVSLLQSASSQNTKRIDDLEQAANEWSSSVMSLETTVERLQSEVCNLKKKCLGFEGRSHCQNIRLVRIEEGREGGNLRQFYAPVLKEILDLQDAPRLDHGHCSLAPKPRDGDRPRPFIM